MIVAKEKSVRVVELFAGVGGFRVGFERCAKGRFQTIWANQWEPGQAGQWAYQCYDMRFGKKANCVNEDISKVIDHVPTHDLLVGGFPCQDYSVARTGARGIEGKKGVLWWSIDAIIQKQHPSYILLENVDRLLKSPANQRGRDFGIILKCLHDNGYAVEWRVINAADYGNVQRRRRTFIFACKSSTKQYKKLASQLLVLGQSDWLKREGFFAHAFPVERSDVNWKKNTSVDLAHFHDLVEITDSFHAAFFNSGMMFDGKIFSEELIPHYSDQESKQAFQVLGDVVSHDEVDQRYFINENQLEKWKYLKGAKHIERTARTGYSYLFSEGPISFPDPLDRPARTMLTSEGTINRSSHVIADPLTGKYRRLTPEECERINGFPAGWTATGMPERQRYFIMGNALVVPLIEKMGETLLEII